MRIDGSRIDLRTTGCTVGTARILRVGRGATLISRVGATHNADQMQTEDSIAAMPTGQGQAIDRDGWLDVKALKPSKYLLFVGPVGGVFIEDLRDESAKRLYWPFPTDFDWRNQ